MKKNYMMRIASVLLVVVLLTTSIISGTLAKYTSSVEASAIATVAKWDIKVNNSKISVSNPNITFDLFDTVKDSNGTGDESDVVSKKIAPGTSGSFAFKIENLSEVNAQYTVALTEKNDSNVPLQYSIDGNTWSDSIGELATTNITNQSIDMTNGESTVTVYWRWMFEGTTNGAHTSQSDESDTSLGTMDTAPTVTITATITVTQVD